MKNAINTSILKITSMLAILFVISGCATVFSGTSQTIFVKAIDSATGAELPRIGCTVLTAKGELLPVPSDLGAIKISKSSGELQVSCKKEGYRQINTAVGDSFDAVTLVNVLFWPGFLVDLATGCHKKYPTHYVVGMEKVN